MRQRELIHVNNNRSIDSDERLTYRCCREKAKVVFPVVVVLEMVVCGREKRWKVVHCCCLTIELGDKTALLQVLSVKRRG